MRKQPVIKAFAQVGLCGLLRLQQSLGTGDPDRQGHPPQATLVFGRMRPDWTHSWSPEVIASLLPETLSLDLATVPLCRPWGKASGKPASQVSGRVFYAGIDMGVRL